MSKLQARNLHASSRLMVRYFQFLTKFILRYLSNFTLKIQINEGPDRPRIETDQPEVLKTIADIVMFVRATADRRRPNLVKSGKTLTELVTEINSSLGITVSRSVRYLHLLP